MTVGRPFEPGKASNPLGNSGLSPKRRLGNKLVKALLAASKELQGWSEAELLAKSEHVGEKGLQALILRCARQNPLGVLQLYMAVLPKEHVLDIGENLREVLVINHARLNAEQQQALAPTEPKLLEGESRVIELETVCDNPSANVLSPRDTSGKP